MKQIMRFHHIGLAKTSLNLSGGEKVELEIIDYLKREGYANIIYTSESGRILFNKIKPFKDLPYQIIGSIKYEKINEIFAYYLRFFQLFFKIRRFEPGFNDIIVSHDNFIPTILYSLLLKVFNPKAKWILIYHMKSPGLFRGFLGEFTHKFNLPNIRLLRFWLEERISLFLAKGVNAAITVNPYNLPYLSRFINKDKTSAFQYFGGIDEDISPRYLPLEKRTFDLVYIGRFHEQKGFMDLIDVVSKCSKKIKDLKLVVMGGGDKSSEDKFRAAILQAGISKNIDFKGYVSGSEKYNYLSQAKIFVMPSYYESYPVVFMEGMKMGLTFAGYNLPVYKPLAKAINCVKIGDKGALAEIITSLLENREELAQATKRAYEFSQNFNWKKTGEELLCLAKKI